MNDQTPPPSLLGLGPAWTRVGYGVLALAVVAFLLNLFVHPLLPLAPGAVLPHGYRLLGDPSGKQGGAALLGSPLGAISLFTMLFSALAGFAWTLVDIVDRRKRFGWLMPMFVCPLMGSLQAIALALYLFIGRETSAPKDGVQ